MKTVRLKYLKFLFSAMAVMSIGLVSCKEDEEEVAPMRMFQPGGAISASSGESSVQLTWKTPANTPAGSVTYTVEVAKDTLFETPVLFTKMTDTTAITFTDEELTVKEIYFARIKTNGTDNSGGESKWLTSNRFSIRGAQLFIDSPVKTDDVTDGGVRLKFVPRAELTRIVLTDEGGATRDIALTPQHLSTGVILIDNLTGRTTYKAEIFAGTKSRGTTTFRTKEPLAGILVDLRGISGRPEVLQDTITQVPNGSTIILKRGQTYTLSTTTNLDRSVTITSGTDLTEVNLASIYFTSNFNIVAGSNIDHLIFRDVNLASDNATSRYVFNISNASTIKTMLFDNVRAYMFRGIVRLQSAPTTITDFTVNNSVIDSIGSYGVINVDVATAKAENIVIRNSTISRAEKVVASRNNSSSVLIENVTVNESPITGQYLVDYSTSGTNNVDKGIIIRNTILGMGKGGSQTIRGARASTTTLIDGTGTFTTADYVASNNLIPNMSAYSGTSMDLWRNPKNGDFHFKTPGAGGIFAAGDPRWR